MTVCCMRVESENPARNGGWIHRLGDELRLPPAPRPRKKDRPNLDWPWRAMRHFHHTKAEGMRQEMSRRLRVSVDVLTALGVGYGEDSCGPFATFPMTAFGHVCGIQQRRRSGWKGTMKYGRAGLFVAEDWDTLAGTILLPEGASDTAALLSKGHPAVGRYSAAPGQREIEALASLLRPLDGRTVAVMAERDPKPEKRGKAPGCPPGCRGCMQCYPGKAGAVRLAGLLAQELDRPVGLRWPGGGAKDAREWLTK